MKIFLTNNKTRNFIWIIAGIILMAVMVAAVTTITDTSITTDGFINPSSLRIGSIPFMNASGLAEEFFDNDFEWTTVTEDPSLEDPQIKIREGIINISAGGYMEIVNLRYDTNLISSRNGILRLSGLDGSNNENLVFNFEAQANITNISSTTGVTEINFGVIDLNNTGRVDTGFLQIATNSSSNDCNAANEGGIYYDTTEKAHFGCNSTVWTALY